MATSRWGNLLVKTSGERFRYKLLVKASGASFRCKLLVQASGASFWCKLLVQASGIRQPGACQQQGAMSSSGQFASMTQRVS